MIRSPAIEHNLHPADMALRSRSSRCSLVCNPHRQELELLYATFDTDAPREKLSATIRCFSSADQNRR
jgi:hypothetical protein